MTEGKRLRNLRHYQKMIDEGRCVCCGRPDERTKRGLRYCLECSERHKENASPRKPKSKKQRNEDNATKREWRLKSIELGICSICCTKDKRTVNGYELCGKCAAKKNKWQREHYNSESQKAYHKARRDKWREQGLCTYCGGRREEPDKMLCIDCRVRAKMKRMRRGN